MMIDIINHEDFINIYQKDDKFLNECFNATSLKELMKNIEKMTSFSYDKFKNVFESAEKMKGSIFEIFAECFFIVNKGDNRAGVYNYMPVKSMDDNGVDAYGIGLDGNPVTVQIKYRNNITTKLEERDIKQFGWQSIVKYKVKEDSKIKNLIIFTTANNLNWHTESKVFLNKIYVINYDTIAKMIDNNVCFWLSIKQILTNSSITYFKI